MKTKYDKAKAGRQKEDSLKPGGGKWVLRLYVAGHTPRAVNALNNLQLICGERLPGKYSIQVIDLLKKPQLARDNQILAIPTLVRKAPLPVKNIIGDLSDTERVLDGLGIVENGMLMCM